MELFAKALRSFESCVLVNNNLWRKLFSSLESLKRFKVILVPFFYCIFNLLSCELDNFTFKVLYWDILCQSKNKIITLLQFLAKNLYLASSIMKKISVSRSRCRYAVKLIFCIAFGSASSGCRLRKFIAIIL